jgi:hypothetical protein
MSLMFKVPVLTGITIEKKVAMFNLRSILISGMALAALLFSLVRPTAVYADDGVPLTASDPYFTVPAHCTPLARVIVTR